MPRAPELPSALQPPSPEAAPEQPAQEQPAQEQPPLPAIARLLAGQWQQVSALHRDYLTRQAEAHARFLHVSQQAIEGMTQAIATGAAQRPQPPEPVKPPSLPGPKFGRAELERLAVGKISELFGPMFAVQDDRRRQTRMPAPPLLLADRVTGIEGAAGSMGTGRIWTQTDVGLDSWYLDYTGRMPAGMMVEAGQADLLLISWLGADLRTGGDRVYRLLGCELTYHSSPVEAGATLRYEICIDRHAEQNGIRLFFFHYDCYAGDDLLMTVRDGQAGFFTDDELADTTGVHWDPGQEDPGAGELAPPRCRPNARRFGKDAIRAFADGRPADCFGPGWRGTRAHVRTPRISDGQLLLIDEVTDVDPAGGPWQRGYLRAETAVHADDWFFAGHFKNDPCMPGTLMFEGGLQAMAFYLAALGFTVDHDGWRFEPVAEHECVLRCRGQVSPSSHKIVYEVFVKELTADPYPTLYADVLGTVDGVKAFHARRAALRLVPDWPMDYWRKLGPPAVQQTGDLMPLSALGGLEGGDHPADHDRAALAGGIRQDYAALLSCAWGRFGTAIGPTMAPFDKTRKAPRLPGPPYHFMTRVIAIDGPLGGMSVGSTVTTEYDVPDHAWYFDQNDASVMPFAVLMEIALQPCGWLAMYAGSVLGSAADLRFRNLDGTGTVLGVVGPDAVAVRTRAQLLDISRSDGMIIETFAVACSVVGGPADGTEIFTLKTTFGFFPVDMLEQQVGLPSSATDRRRLTEPSDRAAELRKPARNSSSPPRLAGPMLLMLDRITGYWPSGGQAGLGRLRAEKDVDPGEWFFKAHFFTDPVQPGSLGVEAMCQLLQWYLIERGLAAGLPNPRFEPVMTGRPVTWKYRGQVVPANERITIEMEVAELGEDESGSYAIATAWLWVDGLRIYEVRDLGMRVISAGPS